MSADPWGGDTAHSYRFGNAELVPVQRQLLVGGQAVPIGSRAFDVLLALIERRDRLVTKNELLDVAWPGLVVEENNLAAQVSALRKLLGPKVVTTIPGLGYRFSAAIDGAEAAPAREAKGPEAAHTNIPTAIESLIGRERDIEEVKARLAEARLVTIVGPGGVGKTRLAQEVARELGKAFKDGVWWVDLATIPAAAMIAPAIAHAARLAVGRGDPGEEVARAIGERSMLLVLDNCEYLAPHLGAVVNTLLAGAPALRILATSQESLKAGDETLVPLDGLALASTGQGLDEARRSAAVCLLERRARAANPRFALDDANVDDAIELCRRLDGLALAIEMAAARLPFISVEVLASRLQEHLGVLRNADRDAAPRHRTLRATLEWSHSLLTPPQRRVLRRLAAFVGSFTLGAAQRVSSRDELDEEEFLDCLSALVDKSLVRVDQANPPRYRLLETTRIFGLEQLESEGELESTFADHAAAMGEIDREVMLEFSSIPEAECLRRHQADYDDLQATFERGHQRADADMAAHTVMALTKIEFARGSQGPMLRHKPMAFSLVDGASAETAARLWYCVAMSRNVPCPGIARTAANRAEVEAWRRVGDRRWLYDALGRLAENLGSSGHTEEGERAMAEARSLEDPGWPPQIRVWGEYYATTVAAYSDDMALFRARIDREEMVAREAGHGPLEMAASMQRTAWALSVGDLPLALQLSPIAVARVRVKNRPSSLANVLSKYSIVLLLDGQLGEARVILSECVPLAVRNDLGGYACDPLALYAVRIGRPREAAYILGFADGAYAAIDDVRRPMDLRVAGLAADAITAALGPEACARLRAAGTRYGKADLLRLAEEVLAPDFMGIQDGARSTAETGTVP